MSATLARAPEPSRPARRSAADWARLGLRALGELLVTLGVVALLFVAYEVWISNLFSERANRQLAHKLETVWARGQNPLVPLPGARYPAIPVGTGLANLYVPRFGPDYHWTILQGTSPGVLADGPGHYLGTALPGQRGNFAVAGHRVGKGEPFLNLDHLRPGDAVVVETKSYWYVYRVKGLDQGLSIPDRDGVPGREIVAPGDGAVLLPYPNHPDRRPSERLMTMTTCHPKFTASERMVVHARLSGRVPAVARTGQAVTRMPAAITRLYRTGGG